MNLKIVLTYMTADSFLRLSFLMLAGHQGQKRGPKD